MKFIDEIEIVVSSGHGGPGKVSFRRESMTPRGGPDGGDGGRGGDLIFRTSRNLNSLVDFRLGKKYPAQNGHAGESSNCTGAHGEPMVLMVPPGTIVRSDNGEVLVDMAEKEEYTLLTGGRGGKGNWFFKTSVNQAPEHAQPGEPGQEMRVKLELKLIADVGIIGLPNAGKSTLISRVSAARPKIADYPFTTLTPNLGVVKVGEFRNFVVADIPGLIKGAHQGVGLGIQFLKHIERTRVFVHLLDVSSGETETVVNNYNDIQNEIKMYDEMNADKEGFFPLTTRPQLVVFNKVDTVMKEDLERMEKSFLKKTGVKPFSISGVTGKNIDKLVFMISEIVFDDESKRAN